jgi:hypothetical protein
MVVELSDHDFWDSTGTGPYSGGEIERMLVFANFGTVWLQQTTYRTCKL